MGIISSLLPNIDSILGVRDSIGAVIQPVFLINRTWFSDAGLTIPALNAQEGYAQDVEVQLLPSPQIVELKQRLDLASGGVTNQGDIMLKQISRNSYTEAQLDGSSSTANVEKLYRVGAKIYQVTDVVEDYVTWKVTLKELTNQARY